MKEAKAILTEIEDTAVTTAISYHKVKMNRKKIHELSVSQQTIGIVTVLSDLIQAGEDTSITKDELIGLIQLYRMEVWNHYAKHYTDELKVINLDVGMVANPKFHEIMNKLR